jgi:hemolysin III
MQISTLARGFRAHGQQGGRVRRWQPASRQGALLQTLAPPHPVDASSTRSYACRSRFADSPLAAPTPPLVALARPRLRGQLHAIAAALSVGALVWLVRSAASIEATVAAWIYGAAAVLCYLTSSTYHLFARSDRARAVLRRADHSMIYVLIAATFTPVCLLAMGGWGRWIIIGTFWLAAFVGVALSVAPNPRLPRFSVALYLILGWAGVAALPALSHHPIHLALVVTAGLLYTVGAILFGRQRPTLRPSWFGYQEFWHSIGVSLDFTRI